MPGVRSVYTTGQVARICKVSQQTIIRCFDTGKLRGFRVPGSRFRRIPIESLRKFMIENRIPLEQLENGKKRVLVVDDDAAIVEMLSDLLRRDGRFDVRTASNGFDAGIETRDFRPDIMLLDYKLPDINGDALCRRLRNDPQHAYIKIIIISGVVDPDEVSGLLAAGADEFIKKPFDIEQVITKMSELLGLAA
ncbi:MAG: response regulator [Phycisphaerales bacterium]|nr:MAG: response regulator [Phycisphaerales bacterium]